MGSMFENEISDWEEPYKGLKNLHIKYRLFKNAMDLFRDVILCGGSFGFTCTHL